MTFLMKITAACLFLLNLNLGLYSGTPEDRDSFSQQERHNFSGILLKKIKDRTITITYNADGFPIYEGTILQGYQYNIIEAKFEKTQNETAAQNTACFARANATINFWNMISKDLTDVVVGADDEPIIDKEGYIVLGE